MILKSYDKLEYVEEESQEESMLDTSNLLASPIQLEDIPRQQMSNRLNPVLVDDDGLSKLAWKAAPKNRSISAALDPTQYTLPAMGG